MEQTMDHHWLVFHRLYAVQYGQSQHEHSNLAYGKAVWMGHRYHWHCTIIFLLVCLLLSCCLGFLRTACLNNPTVVILAELVGHRPCCRTCVLHQYNSTAHLLAFTLSFCRPSMKCVP